MDAEATKLTHAAFGAGLIRACGHLLTLMASANGTFGSGCRGMYPTDPVLRHILR